MPPSSGARLAIERIVYGALCGIVFALLIGPVVLYALWVRVRYPFR